MTKNIPTLRKLAGLSQYQLSAATQIDRTRLSLIENKHVAPTAEEQVRIVEVLLAEISRRNEQFSSVLSGVPA